MITRQQYMDNEATHEAYYEQFVTPEIYNTVKVGIGESLIKASTDEAFNDIPLGRWNSSSPNDKGREAAMRTIRVDFDNGDHLVTSINGSEDTIRRYYIGNQFNIGTGGDDLLVTATTVTFLD